MSHTRRVLSRLGFEKFPRAEFLLKQTRLYSSDTDELAYSEDER